MVTHIETEVKIFWSGEWQPFSLRMLSNRSLEYEQNVPPSCKGDFKFNDLVSVRQKSYKGEQVRVGGARAAGYGNVLASGAARL